MCVLFSLRKGSLRDASASAVALKKHLCEAWSDQRLDVLFQGLRFSDLTKLCYLISKISIAAFFGKGKVFSIANLTELLVGEA